MHHSMKTFIVIGPTPPPVHGVTVALERMLRAPRPSGCSFVHLDTSDHRGVGTIGVWDFLNIWLGIKSFACLAIYCLRYRPDAVYVPISQSSIGYIRDSFYLLITRLFSRAKLVIHLHGGYFGELYDSSGYCFKKYVDLTMRTVTRAIVLSHCFVKIFERWLPEHAIDIVPNGTQFDDRRVERKLASVGRRARRITFLSSLMRSKGVIDFVLAAVHCLEEMPELEFAIAGEWWNEDPTVQPETLGALDSRYLERIHLLGLVTGKQKWELLFKSDVFVLPTYYAYEGQPTVIIEAMAAGCAIISTTHSAIPELVAHGTTGLLVPPRSPRALAGAILRLVNSSVEFSTMAEASYERYRLSYTTQRSNELLLRSLQKAIE